MLSMSQSRQSKKDAKLVPCLPLHALLVALNQTTVDYLSLDVEGVELEVSVQPSAPIIHHLIILIVTGFCDHTSSLCGVQTGQKMNCKILISKNLI